MHTSNLYYTAPQLELAELLIESAFPSRVFFCNSGAEANEGAIKLARKWGKLHRDGAHVIVCAQGAFHGRTMGALAATANPRYRKQFEPLPKGFVHVPYDDLGALEQAIDSATCAVMLEPIEGESGVIPLAPGRLAAIRRLCDERNVLLILDEVQTGHGTHRPVVGVPARGRGAGRHDGCQRSRRRRTDRRHPGRAARRCLRARRPRFHLRRRPACVRRSGRSDADDHERGTRRARRRRSATTSPSR